MFGHFGSLTFGSYGGKVFDGAKTQKTEELIMYDASTPCSIFLNFIYFPSIGFFIFENVITR
jgi:hypothetical protein